MLYKARGIETPSAPHRLQTELIPYHANRLPPQKESRIVPIEYKTLYIPIAFPCKWFGADCSQTRLVDIILCSVLMMSNIHFY